MKKTFLLAIVALMGYCADASAQAFLRGLKDKAVEKVKEKVTNKVEKEVDNTMDALLDGKKKTKSTTSTTTSTTTADQGTAEDYGQRPVTDLINPKVWEYGTYYSVEKANYVDDNAIGNPILLISKSSFQFGTMTDIIAAMPALPSARQILDIKNDDPTSRALINYHMGMQEYQLRRMQKVEEDAISAAIKGRTNNAATALSAMPQTNALTNKLMEAVINSGLDPETATEEQMMQAALKALSQELGIPEAEMAKLMAMGQTNPEAAMAQMLQKYPNAAKKLTAIQQETADRVTEADEFEKYADLVEEASALTEDEAMQQAVTRANLAYQELEKYASQLYQEWEASEEHAKLIAMEQELDKKTNAYLDANKMADENDTPAFWKEARRAENALIDAYNEKLVGKWCVKVQELIDYLKPQALRLADIDNRLNQASTEVANGTASQSLMLQFQVLSSGMGQSLVTTLCQMPIIATDSPRITLLEQEHWFTGR